MDKNPYVNRELIKLVASYPCLYDSDKFRNKKDVKHFAWKAIIAHLEAKGIKLIGIYFCMISMVFFALQ